MKRMNAGRSSDLPLLHESIEYNNPESNSMEFWNIYDRGEKNGFLRWKLAASAGTTVLGTANYSLNVKGNQLYTNEDGSRLRADRPELFAIIEGIAKGNPAPSDVINDDDIDPFGDLALSRGIKLTQTQQWNRALLNMRIYELHWECREDKDNLPPGVVRAPSWEQGVRQAWFGIFRDNFDRCIAAHKNSLAIDARKLGTFSVDTGKTTLNWNAAIIKLTRFLTREMPEEMLQDGMAFITRRGAGEIDFREYTDCIKAFHAGQFNPTPYGTLAASLDRIAGVESVPAERGVPVDINDLLG